GGNRSAHVMGDISPDLKTFFRVSLESTGKSAVTTSRWVIWRITLGCQCGTSFFQNTMNRMFTMQTKRGRDSGSGRFISIDEAKKRPKETTVETVKRRVKKETCLAG
ncbi:MULTISPECIES: hypothetical protein, partial [unclassified Pseudomonas]|uniref:hypothetical protein n=1 Tax=unclassified Pseudomonas TaxID=196821 RepID=UPI002B22B4A2